MLLLELADIILRIMRAAAFARCASAFAMNREGVEPAAGNDGWNEGM